MDKVLICIVVYNINEILYECIGSLIKNNKDLEMKIVVYDNYEKYQTVDVIHNKKMLTDKYPIVQYITENKNLGYGKSANFVYKKYFDLDFQYFIVMNDDIIINSNVIHDIIAKMKNTDICMSGPKIEKESGGIDGPYRYLSIFRRFILLPMSPIIKVFNKNFFTDTIVNKESEIYRLNGSFMVFDSIKFNMIKGFDENLFLYGEELVLTERIKHQNYEILYDDEHTVMHKHSYTISKKFSQITIEKMKFKSIIYYYSKYHSVNKFFLALASFSFYFYLIFYQIPTQKIKEML